MVEVSGGLGSHRCSKRVVTAMAALRPMAGDERRPVVVESRRASAGQRRRTRAEAATPIRRQEAIALAEMTVRKRAH